MILFRKGHFSKKYQILTNIGSSNEKNGLLKTHFEISALRCTLMWPSNICKQVTLIVQLLAHAISTLNVEMSRKSRKKIVTFVENVAHIKCREPCRLKMLCIKCRKAMKIKRNIMYQMSRLPRHQKILCRKQHKNSFLQTALTAYMTNTLLAHQNEVYAKASVLYSR